MGHDVAGTVIRVGPKVRQFKAGDEVYARPRDWRVGTFAEYIAMDQTDVALKPKNLSMEEAASIPLVGLTAWQVLIERANLKKGQKVFIQAGSGIGVGGTLGRQADSARGWRTELSVPLRRPQDFLDGLSNSGPAVRPCSEGRATRPPTTLQGRS